MLADLVQQIIQCCVNIGLNVVAIITDMGASNRAMWKKLGIISNRNSVVSSFHYPALNHRVSVLADVPHLVKKLRNHFVSGQPIKLPGDVVTKYNLPSDVVNVEPLTAASCLPKR